MALPTNNEQTNYSSVVDNVRRWFNEMPSNASSPDYYSYFNDFMSAQDYATGDWTLTTVETGTATEVTSTGVAGGTLIVTNGTADNDSDSFQAKNEGFKLASGKPCWMEMKVKVSDADQEDLFIGLAITDTTPLDASDKIGFLIVDDNINLNFVATKNSTTTTMDTEYDVLDDTYVVVGWHFDGAGRVEYFVNREYKGTVTTNICDDEELAITMHHQNGTNAAKVLTVDYIWVLQQR